MIIDTHVHHVPEAFVRFVEKASPYSIRLDAPRGESVALHVGSLSYGLNRTFFDPERLMARMKQMRVERAVLSLATPFVNFDVPADLGREAAQLYNDEIAALCKLSPDHFAGWAYLPMQDPIAAAKELHRAAALGLVGGHMPSNVKGRYLDSDEFAPIFRAASDLGVPLFVHPSNPPARERMADYELAVVAGYLFDTTLNIFHMIFGGLFDRFPALKLCCTHLGGYAPMLHARMQREIDTNPGLAARLKKPLRDYLRALYFDTICFEPAYARAMIDLRLWIPRIWYSAAIPPSHLASRIRSASSSAAFPTTRPISPVQFCGRMRSR